MFKVPGFEFKVLFHKLNFAAFKDLRELRLKDNPASSGGVNQPLLKDIADLEVETREFTQPLETFLQTHPYSELPFVRDPFRVASADSLTASSLDGPGATKKTKGKVSEEEKAIRAAQAPVRDLDAKQNVLNWKNPTLRDTYDEDWNAILSEYKEVLRKHIVAGIEGDKKEGLLRVTDGKGNSFIDVTQFLAGLDGFTTSAESVSNTITMHFRSSEVAPERGLSLIASPATTVAQVASTQSQPSAFSFIEENDILEFLVRRTGEAEFTRNYIGFVTNVARSQGFGQVISADITCWGLGKILQTTSIIGTPAVLGQFDGSIKAGQRVSLEASHPAVTPFVDLFQAKSGAQIADYIFSNFLNLSPSPGLPQIIAALALRITRLEGQLLEVKKSITNRSPQASSAALPGLKVAEAALQKSLIATREELAAANKKLNLQKSQGFTKQDPLLGKIAFTFDEDKFADISTFQFNVTILYLMYLVRKDEALPGIIQPGVIATIEGGDAKVYNNLIATGFQDFYSSLKGPNEVLDTLKNVLFYEVFENRQGILQVRPPKYNLLDLSDATKSSDGTEITLNSASIISPTDVVSLQESRDDTSIQTRMDYIMTVPATNNTVPIHSGNYKDVGTLINYGLRASAPTANPNVNKPEVGNLFAALGWARSIKDARTQTIVVKNTKDYPVGSLMFLKSDVPLTAAQKELNIVQQGTVGYITDVATTFTYGELATHTLTLKYVRQAEILEVTNTLAGGKSYYANFRRYADLEQLITLLESKPALADDTRKTGTDATRDQGKNKTGLSASTGFVTFVSKSANPAFAGTVVTDFKVPAIRSNDGADKFQEYFGTTLHLADKLKATNDTKKTMATRDVRHLNESIIKAVDALFVSDVALTSDYPTVLAPTLTKFGTTYTAAAYASTPTAGQPDFKVDVYASGLATSKLLVYVITSPNLGTNLGSRRLAKAPDGKLAKVIIVNVPSARELTLHQMINGLPLQNAGPRNTSASTAVVGNVALDPHANGLAILAHPVKLERWLSTDLTTPFVNYLEFDYLGAGTGPKTTLASDSVTSFFEQAGYTDPAAIDSVLTEALETAIFRLDNDATLIGYRPNPRLHLHVPLATATVSLVLENKGAASADEEEFGILVPISDKETFFSGINILSQKLGGDFGTAEVLAPPNDFKNFSTDPAAVASSYPYGFPVEGITAASFDADVRQLRAIQQTPAVPQGTDDRTYLEQAFARVEPLLIDDFEQDTTDRTLNA